MIEVRANQCPWQFKNHIELRIVDYETQYVAEPIVMRKVDVGEMIPVAMHMEPRTAQALMDQLWDCGLRPTEGTGSAGALAATERHLRDMQRLAFHALKVEG